MPLIGAFTRRPEKIPLVGLEKMPAGLSKAWSCYVRDWARSLRAGNYPETTRYDKRETSPSFPRVRPGLASAGYPSSFKRSNL